MGLLDYMRDVAQGASNAVSSNVSGPVDLISWGLRKAGMPIPDAPVGGSQWMRNAGLLQDPKSQSAGLVGETLGLLAGPLAAAKAPQIAAGLLQGGANIATPSTLNKQAGMIAWHGPNPKNDMSANYLQDLISSQRYLDRNIVAKKIRERDFTVSVSPKFEIDGQQVRAIQDGHHALEAAIRSGNQPKFVTSTPKTNDRVQLLKDGNIDGYLEASYHDSPWYQYATKRDLF